MKSVKALGGLCGSCRSDGVNQVDEGLGKPRQVMTAGTHGPSGQLIFDIVMMPHL